MKRKPPLPRPGRRAAWTLAAVLLPALVTGPLTGTPAAAEPAGLRPYRVDVTSPAVVRELAGQGFDVAEGDSGSSIEIDATGDQARALTKLGITAVPMTGTGTAGTSAARKAAEPGTYDVYRPYLDHTYAGTENGKPRPTLYEEFQGIAAAHPDFVKPEVIGKSLQGKPILALRITKDARRPGNRDGSKPSVLYVGGQHAREWLDNEQVRRLTHLFADNYGHRGPAKSTEGTPLAGVSSADLTKIVDTKEIWVVPVANPDGYDISFTPGNRLWRKNARDTNGNGKIDTGDGVDLNRNFPAHWGFDNEDSSPVPTYETYRGTGPESEPETRAMDGLLGRIGFKFLVNYHVTDAERLLYGVGYQIETAAADDPVYHALAGDDATPAIGSNPPGAPKPYIPGPLSFPFRNGGITDDTANTVYHTTSFTVEMDGGDPARGGGGSRFEFQDSDADIEQAFVKNLPFALDIAHSSADPANPVSHLGRTTPAFVPHTFGVSYGTPQEVAVDAKRELGPVILHWSVNGGRERTAATHEFTGGERYGSGYNLYYHQLRGTITGTKAGDQVRVWFTARAAKADPFTYSVRSTSGNPVLVLSAEDYSGQPGGTLESPPYADRTKPNHLQYYRSALDANKVGYDVYDVDAEHRTAPDALGVLSHYKAVIWYTANDSFIRGAGAPGQTGTSKLADDEILAARDYLNEGGKLLYTGQNAANAQLLGAAYNPHGEPPYCDTTGSGPGTVKDCAVLTDDFLQYWLGAYTHTQAAVTKADASTLPLVANTASGPLPLKLDGGDSADNQVHTYGMVTASSLLPARQFPQFSSEVSVGFAGTSPFEPVTGTHYALAPSVPASFERLRKTVDLTGARTGDLSFKVSYDTEPRSDFVLVEAHHAGQDDWTTLPDLNGHTSTDAGLSCDINWDSLHPFLAHYQTNPSKDTTKPDCTSSGTTGSWNAASGNSRGYQDWKVDLSRYAGSQVELSISYVQDFAVSGLGVFVDDTAVTKDGTVTDRTSFEDGLGGWEAGPPPPGTAVTTAAAWAAQPGIGYHFGAGVQTARTVYWGFGLEGVDGSDTRARLLGDALTHLGVRHR
ncbi:M14 family zinc carboxypeptidase [Amycolatopsis sp. DG1A-15b]|uniref:M14 family zinc carboxypeptidase n=1 Tax=Amycolatopsis sp. DG1A-15b TaxID=3052846 RepID=UPI00255C1EBA|nr:M14 family zinc carboxypeptidase [Amycolatopsis sp. DG1A-15b]WIX91436.1 M14 family zinc carboxypeptidase [Amycolatopsis sp. DG1A-15b]